MFLNNIKRTTSKSQTIQRLTSASFMQQRMAQMTFKTSNALNKPDGSTSRYHD